MPRDLIDEEYGVLSPHQIHARAIPEAAPAATDGVLALLVDARTFLSDPVNFWQSGQPDPNPGRARCAILAIGDAAGRTGSRLHSKAFDCLKAALPEPSDDLTAVYRFNDSHSHADVLALFDRAIAARKSALSMPQSLGAKAS